MASVSSLVPNYTLISERGVRIFGGHEEIIEHFTGERLKIVKRRYELLAEESEKKIAQNNEIIRFIKQKHYEQATKSAIENPLWIISKKRSLPLAIISRIWRSIA